MKKIIVLMVLLYASSLNAAQITLDTASGQNSATPSGMASTINSNFDEVYTDKADSTNVLELDNTTPFTPDADYEPATKKYVDDNAGAGGSALEVEDDSTSLDTAVTKLNFIGSGVTAVENADHEIDVTIASGGAPVDSVNGETGTVVLDASDINIVDAGGLITATETDAALAENRTAINLNTAKTGVPSGTDNQMLQFNGSTLEAVDTLGSIGFGLGSDETNLMWDGSDSYKVHLDGIFAPIASPTFTGTVSGVTAAMVGLGNVDNSDATDADNLASGTVADARIASTIARDSELTGANTNTIEFVYSDVTATETGKNIRIPTGSAWANAYSWCDGAEAVLVYDVQYSATLGGSFASAGTIAHDAAATTDTVDISGWTDAAAGSWIHVDISTAGTTATACTLAIQLENN